MEIVSERINLIIKCEGKHWCTWKESKYFIKLKNKGKLITWTGVNAGETVNLFHIFLLTVPTYT